LAEDSQERQEATMEFGAAMFFTDYSVGPAALGRALEERQKTHRLLT
jgi:hypothetical protein